MLVVPRRELDRRKIGGFLGIAAAAIATLLTLATVLFALRVRAEERMMLDEFGPEYEAYMARTKRLVPGADPVARRSSVGSLDKPSILRP